MNDEPVFDSDVYGDMDPIQLRKMHQLVFEVTYPDGRMHIFGTSYVRHVDGHPMWWAACNSCQHVDLYAGINLLRGEPCIECDDGIVLAGGHIDAARLPDYDGKARPLPKRKYPRMYPMRNQEAACTAVLLGGLDAVRVIALKEAAGDQSG